MKILNEKHREGTFFQLRKSEVVELLHGYTPSTEADTAYKEQTIKFLEFSERPFDPSCFSPGHITGSALVLDLLSRTVLLVYHKRLNIWIQPGGHVDPIDRHLTDTATREVLEETGMSIASSDMKFLDIDVHQVPSRGDFPQHLHFDFRFIIFSRETPVRGMSDAEEACWFSIDEAKKRNRGSGAERLFAKCQAIES